MGLDGEGTDGGAEAGHSPIDARIDAHRKSDAQALSLPFGLSPEKVVPPRPLCTYEHVLTCTYEHVLTCTYEHMLTCTFRRMRMRMPTCAECELGPSLSVVNRKRCQPRRME
jgi:hypothetical protein